MCDAHEISLHDHCTNCRGLVRPEQVPLGAESVAICHNCGFDLRRAPAKLLASKARMDEVLRLETRLLRVLDPGAALQREEATGTVVGTGVQVAPGGGDAGMSQRGLHQVNGRPAVEGMGGMRVPEPVGRDGEFDAGAPGGLADDAEHRQRLQNAAMLPLAGAEEGIAGPGIGASQTADESPNRSGHLDGSRDTTFTEDRDLAAIPVRLQVPPAKPTQFADADPRGI